MIPILTCAECGRLLEDENDIEEGIHAVCELDFSEPVDEEWDEGGESG